MVNCDYIVSIIPRYHEQSGKQYVITFCDGNYCVLKPEEAQKIFDALGFKK